MQMCDSDFDFWSLQARNVSVDIGTHDWLRIQLWSQRRLPSNHKWTKTPETLEGQGSYWRSQNRIPTILPFPILNPLPSTPRNVAAVRGNQANSSTQAIPRRSTRTILGIEGFGRIGASVDLTNPSDFNLDTMNCTPARLDKFMTRRGAEVSIR